MNFIAVNSQLTMRIKTFYIYFISTWVMNRIKILYQDYSRRWKL